MWNYVLKLGNKRRVCTQLAHFCVIDSLFMSTKIINILPKSITNLNSRMYYTAVRTLFSTAKHLQENISPLQIKKRPVRKKLPLEGVELQQPGIYNVIAFSTAEEYNLEALSEGLKRLDLYEPKCIVGLPNVLHANAKYQVGKEPREIFFFREGSVVFWNITDVESSNVLRFLKPFEQDRYSEELVQGEKEVMNYRHQLEGKSIIIQNTGEIYMVPKDNMLEKYTFANTLASSVKLGIWEATLDRFIDSVEYVTEDLKKGAKIRMTREEVLAKHGELYGLRHLINLSSELLDTPDFYWEHEELERLYLLGYNYFSIGKRTKVINEKINHCTELIELLSRHLSDRHHIRLEWMIIVLIMVEVGFESVHYIHKFKVLCILGNTNECVVFYTNTDVPIAEELFIPCATGYKHTGVL